MASSVAPALKAGLVAMLRTAFASDPAVLVSYGHPGPTSAPDIVGVMGVAADQSVATLAATQPREESLRVTVLVSCFVGGGDGAQQAATERAYALLALVESALRTDPTVAGIVRKSQVESHDLAEDIAPAAAGTPIGRVAELAVVLRAEARI